MEYIKVTESPHNRKHTSSDSCGHWRQEHTGVGPDENLSCPHSRSRDQHSVGGHLWRWGGLWLPAREKTLKAVTQEKHLLFLCFDCFWRFFWIFVSFFSLFPALLELSIFLALWNLIKLLSLFVFSLSHIFIVINLCLYVGLLQFCGAFLFFFSLSTPI